MDSPIELDPMLVEVWRHLMVTRDADATAAFFKRHVVDGERTLEQIQGRQLVVASSAASLPASSSDPTTPDDGSPRRSKTQVNLARHLEIIERKWLVTGFVAVVRPPGLPARRVPLNYRRIRIGTPNVQPDIALDLPEGTTYESILELREGRFVVQHQRGDVPTIRNDVKVAMSLIDNGDRLSVGPFEVSIFKLLEQTAELTVVSEPGAGERFLIDISEMRLGRPGKRANDINLPSPTVSREHARIILHERKFWLVPESGSSPTAVNGVQLQDARALVDNDQIVLGEQALVFTVRGDAARPRTLQARTATVLFSDLRGWTAVAENTPLQDLILQVNEYYKAMGEVIHRYGGTLMTYLGDALMAVFGAPSAHADDPWRAVASALRMIEVMKELNEKWRAEGKSQLSGGIGIHTGMVMVGELGHSSRLEYSAMGDATNLAARLEQLTKDYKCPLIVSDATYTEVEKLVDARSLGTVTVKGRTTPTGIYHVLALKNA